MPIYAYRCNTCGHTQDLLQKISDAPLTVCTACGAATFVKQVTAAGFQLKGSGWYVTDFRNEQKKESSSNDQQKGPSSPSADNATSSADGSTANSTPSSGTQNTATAPSSASASTSTAVNPST